MGCWAMVAGTKINRTVGTRYISDRNRYLPMGVGGNSVPLLAAGSSFHRRHESYMDCEVKFYM